jgi:hypothetical protein
MAPSPWEVSSLIEIESFRLDKFIKIIDLQLSKTQGDK